MIQSSLCLHLKFWACASCPLYGSSGLEEIGFIICILNSNINNVRSHCEFCMVLCSGIDYGLYFCDRTSVIYQVMMAFCCFGWTQVNFCFYLHCDILMSCNDMGEEAEKSM